MRLLSPILALLFAVSLASSQEVPLQLKGDTEVVKVDKVIVVKEDRTVVKSFPFQIIAPPDVGFYRWSYPAPVKATDKGNVLEVSAAPKGDVKFDLKIESAVIVDGKIKYVTQFGSVLVAVGDVTPPVPPVPPDPPTPKPPDPPKPPTPQPVTSFRVIFVYETAKTLTKEQLSAMDSKVVRDYLTSNTTPEGAYAGFRKYDKDQDSSKDTPTINAMWIATKPSVTTVPCAVIQVNDKIDIVPLASSGEAMVDTFKKYKGGN